MDNKLLIACCVFSFITGVYIAHLIQDGRGCTVEFGHGKEVHVVIGNR
jgi:hypothetical protein